MPRPERSGEAGDWVLRHALCLVAVSCLGAQGCWNSEPQPTAAAAPALQAVMSVGVGRAALPPRVRQAQTLQLRLIVVAELHNVLEPCGCTRRALGGVDRLVSAVNHARADAAVSLVLAVGDLFTQREPAPAPSTAAQQQQDAWRAQALAATLAPLAFDAVFAGSNDLAVGSEGLAAWLRTAKPVVVGSSAPIAARSEIGPLERSALIGVGGRQFGLVAVGDGALLAHTVQRLRAEGAELVIAVEEASVERRTTRGDADVVLRVGSAGQGPAVLDDGALYISAAQSGESLLLVDLELSANAPTAWRLLSDDDPTPLAVANRTARVRYQALDASVTADVKTRSLLKQTFARINAYNTEHAPLPAAPAPGQPTYVGADTCAACHTEAFFWWRKTPHGRAFESLVARGRERDLDCVGCHVTGFERPGGSNIAQPEHLQGVGCESCHGPGSTHANNPRPPHRDVARRVPESVCLGCHDALHSDAFSYQAAQLKLHGPGHGG